MDSRRRELEGTRTGRLARRWRLDRNPLRRASDRAETVTLTLLVLVFLVAAPLASGAWAHAAAQRAERDQAASREIVTAVALTPPAVTQDGAWGATSAAQVRWTAPDGTVVTRELPVPEDTAAGATLRMWTTRDGQLVSHPVTATQVAELTELGEATGPAALAVLLALAGALTHGWLHRRRLAAWDAEWQATGPHWTTRA